MKKTKLTINWNKYDRDTDRLVNMVEYAKMSTAERTALKEQDDRWGR